MKTYISYSIAIVILLSGCDGAYYLSHTTGEIGEHQKVPQSFIYGTPEKDLYVEISGGHTQAPITRQVKAASLDICMNSWCKDSCEFVIYNPSLLSDSNRILPYGITISFFPLGKHKKKEIITIERNEFSRLNRISYLFPPGQIESIYGYWSNPDSLGYFAFPIVVDFGYIIHGADTVSFNGISFNAINFLATKKS